MGSSRSIDILYMEKAQKEWEDRINEGFAPVKFPVSFGVVDVPYLQLETMPENFSPSQPKMAKSIKSESVSTKKNKRKCNNLM